MRGRGQGPRRHLLAQARGNVLKLPTVDDAANPVEWIVSVAMLSEGWDVKNVFQIYPHEKRAFNSKLLVAQVLGRGLRRPAGIHAEPRVFVFNHQRWAPEVEDLVAEVLDQETTIAQRPTRRPPGRALRASPPDLQGVPTGIKAKEVEKPRDIKTLNLRPQRDAPETTEFVSVSDSEQRVVLTTLVRERYYPLAEVVADVRARMLLHDKLTGGDLAKAYPKARVEQLIRDALKRLKLKGTAVSQENRQLIMSAFGSLRQKTMRAGAEWAQEPDGLNDELDRRDGAGPRAHQRPDLLRRPVLRRAIRQARHARRRRGAQASRGHRGPHASLPGRQQLPLQVPGERRPDLPRARAGVRRAAAVRRERRGAQSLGQGAGRRLLRHRVRLPAGRQRALQARRVQPRLLPAAREPPTRSSSSRSRLMTTSPTSTGASSPTPPPTSTKVNELLRRKRTKRRYQFHFLSPSDYDDFFAGLRDGTLKGWVSALQAALNS